VSEDTTCRICRDPRRDQATICVVEESKDVAAIERTREFRGLYHVLGGAISPIDHVGPEDLHVAELLRRLSGPVVTEVILATDPNVEGEATATYLTRLLAPDRHRGVAVGVRPAGRRRPGVRRRGHAGARLLGAARRHRLRTLLPHTFTRRDALCPSV
jgi:recombination protein RecR